MPKRKREEPELVVILKGSASPETKKRAKKTCQAQPGYLSPSKVTKTHDGYVTTSPRKRLFTEVQKTSVGYTNKNKRRNLEVDWFKVTDPSTNNSQNKPSINSLSTYIQKFETVVITADDLKNTPNRKTVESQNSVMGHSAKEEYTDFLKELEKILPKNEFEFLVNSQPKTFNWCHIVAFCLAACILNTQVVEDLTTGSWQCNCEMIPYEKGLRDELLSGNSFSKIEINGYAVNFTDSRVAKEIILNVKLTYPRGNTVEFAVTFDGLTVSRKPKEIARMTLAIFGIFNDERYAPSQEDETEDEALGDDQTENESGNEASDIYGNEMSGNDTEDEALGDDQTENEMSGNEAPAIYGNDSHITSEPMEYDDGDLNHDPLLHQRNYSPQQQQKPPQPFFSLTPDALKKLGVDPTKNQNNNIIPQQEYYYPQPFLSVSPFPSKNSFGPDPLLQLNCNSLSQKDSNNNPKLQKSGRPQFFSSTSQAHSENTIESESKVEKFDTLSSVFC